MVSKDMRVTSYRASHAGMKHIVLLCALLAGAAACSSSSTSDGGNGSGADVDSGKPSDQGKTDSGNAGSTTGPTFTNVYAIFTAKCGDCHTPGDGTKGRLDISTKEKAYQNLVGVKAAGRDCSGGGKSRVAPGNAKDSLLIDKLGPTPSCGDAMPEDGDPLSAAEITLITEWINAGAKND
jgi:hypothetical protein